MHLAWISSTIWLVQSREQSVSSLKFIRGEILVIRMRNLFAFVIAAAVLVSCAGTSAPSKKEMILGSWEANIQGQDIVLTFSETEVEVADFGMSFPYSWVDENTIRMDAMGQVVDSSVEFPTPDQMVQVSDQGTQTLMRVK